MQQVIFVAVSMVVGVLNGNKPTTPRVSRCHAEVAIFRASSNCATRTLRTS